MDDTDPDARELAMFFNRILQKPYYTGVVNYKGVLFPGNHKPLITKELFDKVLTVLSTRRQGERSRIHDHYLKSTVYYGDCGWRLIVHRPINSQGIQYFYYACNGRFSKKTNCHLPVVPQDWLEQQVANCYKTIQIHPNAKQDIDSKLREYLEQSQSDRTEHLAQLAKRRKDIEAKQAKLLSAYYDDSIAMQLLAKEQQRLQAELTTSTNEESMFKQDDTEIEEIIDIALKLLGNCYRLYIKADPTQRRMLNQIFLGSLPRRSFPLHPLP